MAVNKESAAGWCYYRCPGRVASKQQIGDPRMFLPSILLKGRSIFSDRVIREAMMVLPGRVDCSCSTGSSVYQRYLHQSADTLVTELQEVKSLAEQEEWSAASKSFEKFMSRWNKVRRTWAMFTDHFELDNIDMRLARGKEFIRAQDIVNISAEFGEAIQLLEHIPERESLTLHNIF